MRGGRGAGAGAGQAQAQLQVQVQLQLPCCSVPRYKQTHSIWEGMNTHSTGTTTAHGSQSHTLLLDTYPGTYPVLQVGTYLGTFIPNIHDITVERYPYCHGGRHLLI